MTELETMQRAQMYLNKLAQGVDPISNQAVPADSALNQARLAKCFRYVSEVLGQVIANGGVVGQRVKTMDFAITPQQLAGVPVTSYPVRITELTDALYQAAGNPDMKKPNVNKFTEWLMVKGLMKKEQGADGK